MEEEKVKIIHVERKKEVEGGCVLVEIGKIKILMNFGTDDDLSLNLYTKIEQITGITHILLCSSEIGVLGGIVHLEKIGISVPILGTVPIKILGRIELMERVEVLKSFHGREDLEDISYGAFDQIIPLKYMQTYDLGEGVTVGPLNSGGSAGGALWKIQKNDQHWILCDRINHRKEMHLDGVDTSAMKGAQCIAINSWPVKKEQVTRKKRDEELISTIKESLEKNGKAIIITGYSQIPEIVMSIQKHEKFSSFPMALFSFFGKKYFDGIKTILEWMGSSITKRFNEEKENPFNLLNLTFHDNCLSGEVQESIVFVIDKYGDSGFSPVVLPILGASPENTVILTTQSLSSLQEKSKITYPLIKYVKLTEEEIENQNKKSLKEREEIETKKKIEDLVREKIEDSSEEEEDKNQIFCKFWYQIQDEIETEEKSLSYLDYDLRLATTDLVFPHPVKRKAPDEYGEPIFLKETKKEEQEEQQQEEIVEKKIFKISIKGKKQLLLKAKRKTILFTGECDIFNLKAILSGVDTHKIAIYGQNKETRKILYTFLLYSRPSSSTVEIQDSYEVESIRSSISLKIEKDLLLNTKFQELGSSWVGYINAKITKEEKGIFLQSQDKEEKEAICIGTIKLKELKELFIEEKIKSEIIDNKLILNKNIYIYIEGEHLKVEGELSKEFYTAKRILSRSVAFLM
ncbi:cleavage and polyadenylation specificity factor subunit 2 [Nematocida sp. LUAm3]|nr:cleavage and polyadenylation specificity factor subunit 2 [Nematocida sp. LUAm3]KAI5176287.1 cleavage and polyadenylation specificity factor subunit 2 [Nematocida sp. LUAm2]KAI5179241.1 cleavage and polyadenylation specificity factor subunit 2 [Nematocida sp. LUAm1]